MRRPREAGDDVLLFHHATLGGAAHMMSGVAIAVARTRQAPSVDSGDALRMCGDAHGMNRCAGCDRGRQRLRPSHLDKQQRAGRDERPGQGLRAESFVV